MAVLILLVSFSAFSGTYDSPDENASQEYEKLLRDSDSEARDLYLYNNNLNKEDISDEEPSDVETSSDY